MSWSLQTAEEKAFQSALDELQKKAFLSQNDDLSQTVAKGRKFLASVQQMQSLIDANPVFWKGFLEAATAALNNRYIKKNMIDLHSYKMTLDTEWRELIDTRQLIPVKNIAYHAAFGFVGGVGLSASGAALLSGIIAGTITLAMGPGAGAFLAVCAILIGLIFAAYQGYQAYKNFRASNGSQLTDINDFINDLDPMKGQRFAPQLDDHITKNYLDPNPHKIELEEDENQFRDEYSF